MRSGFKNLEGNMRVEDGYYQIRSIACGIFCIGEQKAKNYMIREFMPVCWNSRPSQELKS